MKILNYLMILSIIQEFKETISFFVISVSASGEVDFVSYVDSGNIIEQFFVCIFEI
jgi:hypothetical protein